MASCSLSCPLTAFMFAKECFDAVLPTEQEERSGSSGGSACTFACRLHLQELFTSWAPGAPSEGDSCREELREMTEEAGADL